jgi:hypothetical protein
MGRDGQPGDITGVRLAAERAKDAAADYHVPFMALPVCLLG